MSPYLGNPLLQTLSFHTPLTTPTLYKKIAAIRFLHSRLNSYQMNNEEYRHEQNIIHNIRHNNSYPILPQKRNTPTIRNLKIIKQNKNGPLLHIDAEKPLTLLKYSNIQTQK
jgi:hypothetical protein